jgi:hypothetical protein
MSTQVASGKATSVNELAWKAIQGAYDLQVHVAPDVIERRIDDVGLAEEFLTHGLKGFVLKSHYIPTAERAKVVCRAVPGIQAFGALTLNHSVSGTSGALGSQNRMDADRRCRQRNRWPRGRSQH